MRAYVRTLREELGHSDADDYLDQRWAPGEAQADFGEADFSVRGVKSLAALVRVEEVDVAGAPLVPEPVDAALALHDGPLGGADLVLGQPVPGCRRRGGSPLSFPLMVVVLIRREGRRRIRTTTSARTSPPVPPFWRVAILLRPIIADDARGRGVYHQTAKGDFSAKTTVGTAIAGSTPP